MVNARIYFKNVCPRDCLEVHRLSMFASTISDAFLQRGETQGKPISAPHILTLSAEGFLCYFIPTLNSWLFARDGNCGLSFTQRSITSILQSLNQISLSRDGTSSMKSTHLSLRSAMERTRIVSALGS